jgi:hypothetical protein
MTLQEKTAKDLVWKFYHQIEHAISDEYAKEDWISEDHYLQSCGLL